MPKRKSMGEHLIKSATKGAARGCGRGCVLFITPFLVLVLVFSFGCALSESFREGFERGLEGEEQTTEEKNQETTEEIAVEESEEELGVEESTETVEEKEEEIKKENINKFFEQIKEYTILNKGLDYSTMAYEASVDWVDGKISEKGVGSRYMEISRKVGNDYFLFDMLFTVDKSSLEKEGIIVTDDMERVIELISSWSNKTQRYYEYMANYYYGYGPEYEIEADKIEEELYEILYEYSELTSEMRFGTHK